MRYFKFPKWLKRFYPDAIWDFYTDTENAEKTLYLTFDDGPNPNTTRWLLNQLAEYKAKATFFCIGNNVNKYPKLYNDLVTNGHQVGNHSQTHVNGFYTKTKDYISDMQQAAESIDSKLFRPPYGRMTTKQYKRAKKLGFKTIFWSHITYDFDPNLASAKRLENTLNLVKNGAIVVFHDSDKAFPQLKKELPILLEHWHKLGFQFKSIKL